MWFSEEYIVMYGLYLVFLVFVMELISWLLMLKLYNLMFFWRLRRMLEGFIFEKEIIYMYLLIIKNIFFYFC